jgi:hypothetical protein
MLEALLDMVLAMYPAPWLVSKVPTNVDYSLDSSAFTGRIAIGQS